MKVNKINTGLNDEFTLVTLHFYLDASEGGRASGNIEVQLPGQDYTLDVLKEEALRRGYLVLEAVLAARLTESHPE